MPSKKKGGGLTPTHLPGTTLEGGGQLLRLAIGLSSLTRVPIHITDIRGKRSGGGGLKAQHLTSVIWLAQASDARVSGAGLKSKELQFAPATTTRKRGSEEQAGAWAEGGEVVIKQSTPGSINLVLQAILPYLLFAGPRWTDAKGTTQPLFLRITGGTNVSNSPSYDYIAQVLIPMLALIGIPPITPSLHSRGWSHGGTKLGSVTYAITPLPSSTVFPAFKLTDRGKIQSLKATVIAPRDYERQFREELDSQLSRYHEAVFGSQNRDPDIEIEFEDSHHEKRFYLLLVATSSTGVKLGRDWLYNQAVRAGKTGNIASNMVRCVISDLTKEISHGGCVDEYLRDQLVVFQALAEGKSEVDGGQRGGMPVEPSLHAKTAQWVTGEILSVEFDIEGACDGIGYRHGIEVPQQDEVDHADGNGALAERLEELALTKEREHE